MTFNEVIERLRDGRAYNFGHQYLKGHFYKAQFPEDPKQTEIDGASSAITFWENGKRASPTLMLYDFDNGDIDWYCNVAFRHPSLAA